MNNKSFEKTNKQEGITLFVTLVLMAVLLGVSASILNITLKQYQLAGVSYASEIAFQAANAGMECALYQDWISNEFDEGENRDSTTCFGTISSSDTGHTVNPLSIDNGDGIADSREEQRFGFEWSGLGSETVCTEFSVYKFYSDASDVPVQINGEEYRENPCPQNSVCTVIQSRGYNVGCNDIDGARVVEREYTQVY